MPSKTYEEMLNNMPAQDKAKLEQARSQISNAQETNSTEITQHSTPNDTYQDAHRTAAPTAEKGNSATVSQVSNTAPSTETPQPTPEPDKDR